MTGSACEFHPEAAAKGRPFGSERDNLEAGDALEVAHIIINASPNIVVNLSYGGCTGTASSTTNFNANISPSSWARVGQIGPDGVTVAARNARVPRQLLAGRHEPAIAELGDVEVDVRVIESSANLALQYLVEHAEIDDETGDRIDRTGDRHVAHVTVTVEVRSRTRTEHGRIPLVTPLGDAVSVRRSEGDAAGQEGGHDEEDRGTGAPSAR